MKKSDILKIIAFFAVLLVLMTLLIARICVRTWAVSFSPPSKGAGRHVERVESHDAIFTAGASIDTHDAQTGEKRFAEDIIVPDIEDVPESCISCIPEPDPIIETDIDALIVQVAGEYGLPWELVRAVCWVESGFDTSAISATGDYGIMQVSYINHGAYGLTDPLDPAANLRAGCAILRECIDYCNGDFTKALMCYNRGCGYAMNQWRDGIFSTDYTNKVLERYYAYLRGER